MGLKKPQDSFYVKIRSYYDIALCDASKDQAEKLDRENDLHRKVQEEAIGVIKHSYKWKNELQRLSIKLGTD